MDSDPSAADPSADPDPPPPPRLSTFSHRPPCKQGPEKHSSTSDWQRSPDQPGAHVQEKLATAGWLQLPPFWQGSDAHSSTSISQFSPLQPAKHTHPYRPARTAELLEESAQSPCTHGLLKHSSTSTSQCPPAYPTSHTHRKAPVSTCDQLPLPLDSLAVAVGRSADSSHTPPFWQGVEPHSSRSSAQVVPDQPALQLQSNEKNPGVHVPP